MDIDKNKLSKFLKESVEWLQSQEMGCTTLKLDDTLAVCVGWQSGYGDEARDDVIQGKDEPDWGIVAGIKAYNTDDMRTDYEFIGYPYYEDGEVCLIEQSISPKEDYDALADYLLKEYDGLKGMDIGNDGLIHTSKKQESVCKAKGLNEEKESDLDKVPFKDIIVEYFDYSGDFDFLNIVASILMRVDDYSDEEDVMEAMDADLIYTSDQWKVIEHYCTPENANYNDAMDALVGDLLAIAGKIAESNKDDEDDEDEEDEVEDDTEGE